MNKEIEIPEGYEARIEGNKVILEKKESEDEGIRKFIIDCIDELRRANAENADFNGCCSEAIAYLEKQKEQKPIEDVIKNIAKNKEAATKFLKSAGIMDDNGELAEMYRSDQEPLEWSEDERIRKELVDFINHYRHNTDLTSEQAEWTKKAIAYLEEHKEPTWTAEDESFVKHILPRILNPDKWTLDQISADKRQLTAFIERQKRKYAKEQQPAEWKKNFVEEVNQISKRYPEISFAKLCRIAKHFVEWGGKYKPSEWSEEDEKIAKSLAFYLETDKGYFSCNGFTKDEFINFLKFFHRQPKVEWSEEEKERIRQNGRLDVCYNPEKYGLYHKTEWGEEDEQIGKEIIFLLKNADSGKELTTRHSTKEMIAWLEEKLKSSNHSWKPSEEQMNILDKVYHYLWADRNATADMQDGLGDFIDELKKL